MLPLAQEVFWEIAVNSTGLLRAIHVSQWLPFVHFINMLRLGCKWKQILADMASVSGKTDASDRHIRKRRHLYQGALTEYLKQGDLMIGKDKGDVVVFDETNLGTQMGIRKAPQSQKRATSASRPLVRTRIAKRLPARTVWRRSAQVWRWPASLLKRPSTSHRNQERRLRRKPKGPDLRSDGRWWRADGGGGPVGAVSRQRQQRSSGGGLVAMSGRRQLASAGEPARAWWRRAEAGVGAEAGRRPGPRPRLCRGRVRGRG